MLTGRSGRYPLVNVYKNDGKIHHLVTIKFTISMTIFSKLLVITRG